MRLRIGTAILFAAALGGCSLGGLLGGGGKPPTTLVTLTPEAAEPAQMARNASAGQSVTITTPSAPKELMAVRVPVHITPTAVPSMTHLPLTATPDRLSRRLLAKTVRRTTSRVVLDPGQTSLDPGVTITGELQRFGYDTSSRQVVVTYDAAMSTAGGNAVQTRRFTASIPSDGTAPTVGPALNRAANQVAMDVARWIGG